jgi:hypothetical protein
MYLYLDLVIYPKNGRWNAEPPLVPGTVEAFVPGDGEA